MTEAVTPKEAVEIAQQQAIQLTPEMMQQMQAAGAMPEPAELTPKQKAIADANANVMGAAQIGKDLLPTHSAEDAIAKAEEFIKLMDAKKDACIAELEKEWGDLKED